MLPTDPGHPPGPPGLLQALRQQAARGRLEEGVGIAEGLRERKKRLTRQLISDTATGMFLKDGFDAVRVADVAAASGVSEKTVYNYFPTKESLILDRYEDMENDVRHALGPDAAPTSPVEAAVGVIVAEIRRSFDSWGDGDHAFDPTLIRRFSELVERTPALRAAQREMMDRVVEVAAEAMAARAAVNPEDPEPQIAANAILGLWRVQYRALARYAGEGGTAAEVGDAVIADVRRAARLIDTGLWSFGLAVQGSGGHEQLRLAAESANEARKQVLTAIRQARSAWRQVKAEAKLHEHHAHHKGRPRRGNGSTEQDAPYRRRPPPATP
jgi:AcrR family transcriptional regulator